MLHTLYSDVGLPSVVDEVALNKISPAAVVGFAGYWRK
jgi:hypothetical protein